MMTMRQMAEPLKSIPSGTSWYLGDVAEFRGKQELYTKQSPQKLKALRVGQLGAAKGEKTQLVMHAIEGRSVAFNIADIQRQCPGVSLDLIRHVLKLLREQGKIKCLGRGSKASWQKTGN